MPKDDVGFIPCVVCKQPHLGPKNQQEISLCHSCEESKRKSYSKSKLSQEGLVEPAASANEPTCGKLSKILERSKLQASSRSKLALKTAMEAKMSRDQEMASNLCDLNPSGQLQKLKTTLQTMEGELTCAICLELYAKPVTLNEWLVVLDTFVVSILTS